jgi:alpha-N-acetylglucosamine transferase
VTKDVRESKRQRLRDDGATVIEVDQIEHNISISEPRWVQTITKLRVFDPTAVPFSTVLYLDTDIVLTRPIDSIFSDPGSKKTSPLNLAKGNVSAQDPLPEKYTMAASPESGKLDHPYPYLDTEQRDSYFNSGFFMYSPSAQLFEHYMSLLKESEIWYHGFPDQDLLNYAHRLEGPMPWQKLHFSWHLNWPNDNDLNGGMAALHAKWWKGEFVSPSVKEYALSRRWEMEGYWMGRAYGWG